jgi:hypothetical protein
MKIFEKDGKYNFVDDNNVFVGFCSSQCCCEYFGYSITREYPEGSGDDEDQSSKIDLTSFNFDTEYFTKHHTTKNQGCEEYNVVFRLTNEDGEAIFLTLFNHHNGYYSHGFEVAVGGEVIMDDYL